LTHTFIKKTEKIPDAEIDKDIKYRGDFLGRYNEIKIKELL
jgi:phage-related protein